MQRFVEICRHAAVFVAAAGVVALVAQRAFDDPNPSFAEGTPIAEEGRSVKGSGADRPIVYRIYENRPSADPSTLSAARSAEDPPATSEDLDPPDEKDEVDAETLEKHEALVERGHELVDRMVDIGVADPDRADELRVLVTQLPMDQRVELAARISIAVNQDGLEVDPAHLPI